MRHFGFGFYSRQGAKNAKFRTIFLFFFAAFASLREILRFFWLRLCHAVIFARFVVTRGLGLWQITAFPPKFLGRGVQGNHQRSIRAIAAHAFERQRTGFLPGDFILTRF